MRKEDFTELFGDINEKYILEARAKRKAGKTVFKKWAAVAACLCLVVVGIYFSTNKHPAHQITLQYNEVSSVMSNAPIYSEDIVQVESDVTEISELLGYDIDSCIPSAMKSYAIKYYIVTNIVTNEILKVTVDAKEARDTTPHPGIRFTVGFGKRQLVDYIFYEEETVYSTINGVEICATVVPERTYTNASGKEKTTPAVYTATFEQGDHFYYIESRGGLEQVVFDELVCSLVKSASASSRWER